MITLAAFRFVEDAGVQRNGARLHFVVRDRFARALGTTPSLPGWCRGRRWRGRLGACAAGGASFAHLQHADGAAFVWGRAAGGGGPRGAQAWSGAVWPPTSCRPPWAEVTPATHGLGVGVFLKGSRSRRRRRELGAPPDDFAVSAGAPHGGGGDGGVGGGRYIR